MNAIITENRKTSGWRRILNTEDTSAVRGGSWYNAPEAPECPRCHSRDTFSTGFFLCWVAGCRSCGAIFDDEGNIDPDRVYKE